MAAAMSDVLMMAPAPREEHIRKRSQKPSVPRMKGRFCKYKPDNDSSIRINAKRKAFNARKELRNNELFDRFISLFFIAGDENDWIPTSESSGPLVKLGEIIFKKSYLLTRRARSEKVKLSFFGGDHSKVEPITKRIVTRDARLKKGKTSRVTIFSGRRLPLVQNCTKELQPLRDWLEQLEACGALRCESADEAFAACLGVFKSYVMVDGRRAYQEYPTRKDHDSTCVEVGCPEIREVVVQNTIPASTMQLQLPSTDASDGNGGCNASSENGLIPTDQTLVHNEEGGNEHESEDGLMDIFFGIAQDDYMYALFCIIFDDDFPHKLEIASGLFMSNKRSKDTKLFPFLHDILLYLNNRRSRTMDPESHREREIKLKHVACLLTEVRELKGLQTYKEMRNSLQYKMGIDST